MNPKCTLVVIFNHNYEKNLDLLRRTYADRFNRIWFLMPFSKNKADDVIPVYDGSFTFQSFVAHAHREISRHDDDLFLFISDDLILDPAITQENIIETLGMQGKDAFLPEIIDMSTGRYRRGLLELAATQPLHKPGLESQQFLPTKDEAMELIGRHISLESQKLSKYEGWDAKMIAPYYANRRQNWSSFKANVWHFREKIRYAIHPVTMEYPMLAANADIIAIRKDSLELFAHYCGILASMRVFVELAIPTAMALACESISTENETPRRGVNYVTPWKFTEVTWKHKMLAEFAETCGYRVDQMSQHWPKEYFYLHPLKLSKWR